MYGIVLLEFFYTIFIYHYYHLHTSIMCEFHLLNSVSAGQKHVSWNCLVTRSIGFLEPFLHRFFSSPKSLVKIWWTVVWVKLRFSPIILSTNDLNAQDPGFCRHFQRFLKLKAFSWFIFNRLPSFWKCLKPPKNLGSWQNTISVGLLKFSKSFRCTVPKSVARPDSPPLLEIVTHF